jgi:hypothetical protein
MPCTKSSGRDALLDEWERESWARNTDADWNERQKRLQRKALGLGRALRGLGYERTHDRACGSTCSISPAL